MDNSNLKNKGPLWQEGLRVFADISGWIVGPIVVALFAGKALDAHFGTKPWIFLALTVLAFGMTIRGIVKVVKNYMKKLNQ